MEDRLKFRVWDEEEKDFVSWEEVRDGLIDINYLLFEDAPSLHLQRFTGLLDVEGGEIYEDDILLDEDRNIEYRVYSLRGGFGIKAVYWADSKEELTSADTLIIEPLANAQTRSYITGSCKIIGNFRKK